MIFLPTINSFISPSFIKMPYIPEQVLTNFFGILKIYQHTGFNPDDFRALKDECKNCEEEMFMNATELIRSKGIPCEEHFVTTEDGYILGLQRLVRNTSNKLPVLLVHGLLTSSDGFVINLRNQSLAYILYDLGFDVWLGNVRGNKYSRSHETLDPDTKSFWRWSFDEMGRYDVIAMIEHILNTTGHLKINYIGHSQGSVVFVSAVVQNGRRVSDKVKNFFALAPAGLVNGANSEFRLYSLFTDLLPDDGEFMHLARGKEILIGKYCMRHPLFCKTVLYSTGIKPRGQFNTTRLAIYGSHEPTSTSIQNLKHWSQMSWQREDGVFFYDYENPEMNLQHYNQVSAPFYDFSRFNVSTYMYCGRDDAVVFFQDCRRFSKLIPSLKRFFPVDNFTHADFVYGINSKKLYKSIARKMRK